MADFDSLTWALEAWFDRPLCDLPEALRQRVQQEFFPMPWDQLSADQRRSVALQLDYQHDPATEQDQKFWWDFFERVGGLKKQVAEWEAVATPTAAELATKEGRLAELQQELTRMEAQKRAARGDYFPERPHSKGQEKPHISPSPGARYIPYPKAMQQLVQRLGASPEELAAWIFMGPEHGGIAAYVSANELDSPPRFAYAYFVGTSDYIAPLMGCWFKADDVEQFVPADRYIVGAALIERWNKRPGLRVEAFIHAKIAESRLLDIHPIYGGTQGTFSEKPDWPGLESGLFALAEVLHIEAEDFGDAHALTEPFTANPELMSHEVTAEEIPISSPLISITARKTTVKRGARKPQTLKKHSAWQKAYRQSMKENPGKSDVWHANHIARLDVGRGASPDTIRKNMKTRK